MSQLVDIHFLGKKSMHQHFKFYHTIFIIVQHLLCILVEYTEIQMLEKSRKNAFWGKVQHHVHSSVSFLFVVFGKTLATRVYIPKWKKFLHWHQIAKIFRILSMFFIVCFMPDLKNSKLYALRHAECAMDLVIV